MDDHVEIYNMYHHLQELFSLFLGVTSCKSFDMVIAYVYMCEGWGGELVVRAAK